MARRVTAAGTLALRVDSAGAFDSFIASGAAATLGGTLRAVVQPGLYANSTPYTAVVIATGGVPDLDWLDGAEHCQSVWDVLSAFSEPAGRQTTPRLSATQWLDAECDRIKTEFLAQATIAEVSVRDGEVVGNTQVPQLLMGSVGVAVTEPAASCPSSAATGPAACGRSAGAFASRRSTRARSAGEKLSGRTGTLALRCASITAKAVAPR